MSGDDVGLVDMHEVERFDEVGHGISKMGEYFLRKGYDPLVVAKKMRLNAEILENVKEDAKNGDIE